MTSSLPFHTLIFITNITTGRYRYVYMPSNLPVPTTDKFCQFVSTDKPIVFDLINRVPKRSELRNRQLTNSVSTDKPTVFDLVNRGLHRSELTNRQLTNSVSLSVPTSVACLSCSKPNDETFNICARCGYKRKRFDASARPLKKLKFTVDESAFAKRLADLSEVRQSSPYVKQKLALEAELSAFLAAFGLPKDLQSCRPSEIVKFLIWKDQAGRTKIHNDVCEHLGRKGPASCSCLTRLAFGTVDYTIGKLKSIFAQNNRVNDWDPILGLGNPASALTVSPYLASIRSEQLQVRVTPSQANPFLLPPLELLCRCLRTRLLLPMLEPLQVFILARDQAFFKALFFSGDRASDLANVKTADILRLPDNSGFLFTHVWTKTLGTGIRIFSLLRGDRIG